jgi:Transposase DDE domain
MKESFITAVTKARQDANMRYMYKGAQSKGRGRKKRYDGKVNWQCMDKRRWKLCYEDDHLKAYEAVLYSVALKQQVKVVYVQSKDRRDSYEVLLCTDTMMSGQKVISYYRLRFQIEFLIRDAKTSTGMEHCQARSEEKLYNHFNMAMLSISVVKYRTWAKLPDKQQVPFSIRSIKTYCLNKYMANTIFLNLDLDLSCNKIKRLYNQCLNIGCMAA